MALKAVPADGTAIPRLENSGYPGGRDEEKRDGWVGGWSGCAGCDYLNWWIDVE